MGKDEKETKSWTFGKREGAMLKVSRSAVRRAGSTGKPSRSSSNPTFMVASKRVDLTTILSDEEGVRGKQVRDRGFKISCPSTFSNSVLELACCPMRRM